MSWAMELSPAGFEEMLTDLSMMDRKTGIAFLRLLAYVRRFGSVPSGERAFISILGVTRRFFHEVAWPLLGDRVAVAPDGQRYYCPGVTRAERTGPPSRTSTVPTDLSEVRRAAAQASHASRRAGNTTGRNPEVAANQFAKPVQNGLQNHANPDANQVAKEVQTGADLQDFATGLAPDTHSLSSPPPSDMILQGQEGGGEECVGARASAGGEPADLQNHANGLQNGLQNHANGLQNFAKVPTKSMPPDSGLKSPRRLPLPPNWEPKPDSIATLVQQGHTPTAVLAKFRSTHIANGTLKADWDAAWDFWCLDEAKFGPTPARQTPLMRQLPGTGSANWTSSLLNWELETRPPEPARRSVS